jgi:hypothetical protein
MARSGHVHLLGRRRPAHRLGQRYERLGPQAGPVTRSQPHSVARQLRDAAPQLWRVGRVWSVRQRTANQSRRPDTIKSAGNFGGEKGTASGGTPRRAHERGRRQQLPREYHDTLIRRLPEGPISWLFDVLGSMLRSAVTAFGPSAGSLIRGRSSGALDTSPMAPSSLTRNRSRSFGSQVGKGGVSSVHFWSPYFRSLTTCVG